MLYAIVLHDLGKSDRCGKQMHATKGQTIVLTMYNHMLLYNQYLHCLIAIQPTPTPTLSPQLERSLVARNIR